MPTFTTTPDTITVRHEIEDAATPGHVVVWTYMQSSRSTELVMTGVFTRAEIPAAIEKMTLIERTIYAMANLVGDTYVPPVGSVDKYNAIWAAFDRQEEAAGEAA